MEDHQMAIFRVLTLPHAHDGLQELSGRWPGACEYTSYMNASVQLHTNMRRKLYGMLFSRFTSIHIHENFTEFHSLCMFVLTGL